MLHALEYGALVLYTIPLHLLVVAFGYDYLRL